MMYKHMVLLGVYHGIPWCRFPDMAILMRIDNDKLITTMTQSNDNYNNDNFDT